MINRKHRSALLLVSVFGCLTGAPPHALAYLERLDDSASPRPQVVSRHVLSEEGVPLTQASSGASSRYGIVSFGRIEYRLATARYIGRRARIYYAIPPLVAGLRSPAGLELEWRGNGAFASGSARPGEHKLVWSGTVRDASMSESLELSLRVDLQELQLRSEEPLSLEPYFEIDPAP